ncbi:hypothetical protein [Nocardiopsis sp. NPDC006938]
MPLSAENIGLVDWVTAATQVEIEQQVIAQQELNSRFDAMRREGR